MIFVDDSKTSTGKLHVYHYLGVWPKTSITIGGILRLHAAVLVSRSKSVFELVNKLLPWSRCGLTAKKLNRGPINVSRHSFCVCLTKLFVYVFVRAAQSMCNWLCVRAAQSMCNCLCVCSLAKLFVYVFVRAIQSMCNLLLVLTARSW